MDKIGISPDAIARAIVFAIEQPADVDVGEIIVRPTAQSLSEPDWRSTSLERAVPNQPARTTLRG